MPSTSSDLPYDPGHWEQRLEKARAERAEVLRRRRKEAGDEEAPAPGEPAPEAERPDPVARVLRAPTGTRPVPAPPPPVVDPAERPVRATERRWKVIAFGCLGLALLCIGIAIGAIMAGRLEPVAEAPATRTITVETGPVPSADPVAAASVEPPSPSVADPLAEAALARPAEPEPEEGVASAPEPADADPAASSELQADVVEDATAPSPDSADEDAAGIEIVVEPEAGPEAQRATDGTATIVAEEVAPGADVAAMDAGIDALEEAARSGLRLVVHAPPSVGTEGRNAVSDALQSADLPVADPITVNLTISETHLRFYHEEDRAAAQAIAGLLDIRARDFTSYRPTPQDRIVEIWMEGRGTRGGRRTAQPSGRAPQLPELVDRISRILRDRLQ
ncbi:hypothetical protein [uncultured Jannaschia sp.]|uniref:hypothetical protein n=1 Tax=uncultured Jannaschia sp. TaxID=293347 RepID=UPI00263862F5|nr:hypothetical protein [uncultured Jannaschia sp.]